MPLPTTTRTGRSLLMGPQPTGGLLPIGCPTVTRARTATISRARRLCVPSRPRSAAVRAPVVARGHRRLGRPRSSPSAAELGALVLDDGVDLLLGERVL